MATVTSTDLLDSVLAMAAEPTQIARHRCAHHLAPIARRSDPEHTSGIRPAGAGAGHGQRFFAERLQIMSTRRKEIQDIVLSREILLDGPTSGRSTYGWTL